MLPLATANFEPSSCTPSSCINVNSSDSPNQDLHSYCFVVSIQNNNLTCLLGSQNTHKIANSFFRNVPLVCVVPKMHHPLSFSRKSMPPNYFACIWTMITWRKLQICVWNMQMLSQDVAQNTSESRSVLMRLPYLIIGLFTDVPAAVHLRQPFSEVTSDLLG